MAAVPNNFADQRRLATKFDRVPYGMAFDTGRCADAGRFPSTEAMLEPTG